MGAAGSAAAEATPRARETGPFFFMPPDPFKLLSSVALAPCAQRLAPSTIEMSHVRDDGQSNDKAPGRTARGFVLLR